MPLPSPRSPALRLVPESEADSFGDAVEAFRARLIAEGRAPLTISAYRRDLGVFGGLLAECCAAPAPTGSRLAFMTAPAAFGSSRKRWGTPTWQRPRYTPK
jgi:hypothetical protein